MKLTDALGIAPGTKLYNAFWDGRLRVHAFVLREAFAQAGADEHRLRVDTATESPRAVELPVQDAELSIQAALESCRDSLERQLAERLSLLDKAMWAEARDPGSVLRLFGSRPA